MPRPRLAMRKIREVLRLALGEGLSCRQVGSSLGVPLTTVADHLRAGRAGRAELAVARRSRRRRLGAAAVPARRRRRPSSARSPDFKHVHKELRRKGVTLMLLWLEYKESAPRRLRLQPVLRPLPALQRTPSTSSCARSTGPARSVFVDFPGQPLPIYDRKTGAVAFEAELFVAVLGASNYLYAEAVRSQELAHWVTAHVHAFEFFGAVHGIVVCDNLRSGVTRPHRYEPDVNATYQEMAAHYGRGGHPDPAPQAPGQGQGRGRSPSRRALDPGPAAQPALLLARRGQPGHQRARRGGQRPAVQEAPRVEKEPLRELDRPAHAAAPRAALRVRHAGTSGERSTSTTTSRSTTTSTPSPTSLVGRARRRPRGASGTVEVFTRGRRVASHVRSSPALRATPPIRRTCPSRTAAMREWTPGRIVSWAQKTGPATAALAEGIMARAPTQSRAFARASASCGWPTATAPSGSRPPAGVRWRPGPSPTRASSPSCATASTPSRCSAAHPVAHPSPPRQPARPGLLPMRGEAMLDHPDHRRAPRPAAARHGPGPSRAARAPRLRGPELRGAPRAARRPGAHRAPGPAPRAEPEAGEAADAAPPSRTSTSAARGASIAPRSSASPSRTGWERTTAS